MMNWQESLILDLAQMLARHADRIITLDDLKKIELPQIVQNTRSRAKEPWCSLERECQ
jgi:hypothetical protein